MSDKNRPQAPDANPDVITIEVVPCPETAMLMRLTETRDVVRNLRKLGAPDEQIDYLFMWLALLTVRFEDLISYPLTRSRSRQALDLFENGMTLDDAITKMAQEPRPERD